MATAVLTVLAVLNVEQPATGLRTMISVFTSELSTHNTNLIQDAKVSDFECKGPKPPS